MASIDFQPPSAPRSDSLGRSLLVFHLAVGGFVFLGWMIPLAAGLVLYLFFIPLMAAQWLINRGSCVINNIETWLRSGRWTDPHLNPQEGRFLATLSYWLFRIRPSDASIDASCYAVVLALWLLGLGHLAILEQPQLVAAYYG